MKSSIPFTIAMVIYSIVSGQHITDTNNNWLYGELNWDTQAYQEYQIKIDGDTLINGQTYATFLRNDVITNPVWYRLNYYIREDTEKRVYIIDSTGQEGLLFHFGLEINQEVTLWNGFVAKIISIDSVQVANSQMAKRVKIKAVRYDIQGNEDCITFINWIDGIGNLGPMPINYCPELNISYALGCFFRDDSLYYPSESNWCGGFETATEPVEKIAIELFPNPVADILNVRFDFGSNKSNRIQLYNSYGQLLDQYEMSGESYQINMSQFANGIYILQILNPDNNLIIKKIVKQ